MITQFISGLANEELLRISDDIAAAITDSSIDESPLPLLFLSLLALFNHERVVRVMRPSACVTSSGVEARQRHSRQRPASTRTKTPRLSAP
jgi:hypothetical protein